MPQVRSDPHSHKLIACLLTASYFYILKSRILSCCRSPLACWSGLQMVNSTGPRQDPCGTQLVRCFFSERVPLMCTCWVLWESYDVNHFKAVPPTPKSEPQVSSKMLWLVMSNTALRSSMTMTFGHPCSVDIRPYLQTCFSVLWNALKADWPDGKGRTMYIVTQMVKWYLSVSLEINGLKLGKTSLMPSFFRRGLTTAFPLHRECPILRDLFTKVLIWEKENRGIPSRAMLE